MKHFQQLLAIGLVLLLATTAHAKAAFKGKAQMIETAQAIAVVEITHTETVSVKGQHWTYQQEASARVERVLKGTLADEVALYGDETFICAHCHFEVGRYLVFLDHDGELLTGNNWHLSVRKITQNTVAWFANDRDIEQKSAALSDVLQAIEWALARAKPAEPT